MGQNIYVEVEPVNPTTSANCVRNATTHVKVGVGYSKGKGIVASAYPVERRGDGIESILITSGKYMLLAPASRLNRKQVAAWEDTAKNHVALRLGEFWVLVLKLCENNGLKPKGE